MNGQFEGQSYVKDFVDSYDQALEKIKAYDDGLAVLSDEEYLRLVKNKANSNFTVLINEYIRGLVKTNTSFDILKIEKRVLMWEHLKSEQKEKYKTLITNSLA